MRTLFFLASLAVGCVVAPACDGQVLNPGFEEAMTSDSRHPAYWGVMGGPDDVRLDDSTKFSGARSLRIVRSTAFSGAGQGVSAAQYAGKLVRLAANVKGKDIGEGAVGIWLRGDDERGKATFFATSYHLELRGTTGWESRQILAVVPANTHKLVFGPAIAADGILWVDNVQIEVVDPSLAKKMSPLARAYLEEAIGLIRKNAYYSDRVDWETSSRMATTLASGASTPEDTYASISHVLSALGDRHSRLISRSSAEDIASNQALDGFGIRSRSVHGHGYVQVPTFLGGNKQRGTAFVDQVQQAIEDLDAAGTCGWIVDLRSNGGGNMYPMISGLSPLLGDGVFGYFIGKEKKESWYLKGGRSGIRSDIAGPTRMSRLVGAREAPVAVLIGPGTSSSGEATLVSFLGRPRTRTFGQSTSGQSTANALFPLSDGAQIALTTAILADRTGRMHGGPIAPDQPVAETDRASNSGDRVLETASTWLDARIECSAGGRDKKAE